MKNVMIFIANCILIIGCRSYIPCTQYFNKVSAGEIESIVEDSLSFKTVYIDNMFHSLGTFSEPNISFDIKYDTLSHYTIIAGGKIFFSGDQERNQIEIKSDSIEMSYIIVKKKGEQAKRYSGDNSHRSAIDKSWKDCPIPSSIMRKIRKDFFIRMKYRRYRVSNGDSLKGLTVMRQYQLF